MSYTDAQPGSWGYSAAYAAKNAPEGERYGRAAVITDMTSYSTKAAAMAAIKKAVAGMVAFIPAKKVAIRPEKNMQPDLDATIASKPVPEWARLIEENRVHRYITEAPDGEALFRKRVVEVINFGAAELVKTQVDAYTVVSDDGVGVVGSAIRKLGDRQTPMDGVTLSRQQYQTLKREIAQ